MSTEIKRGTKVTKMVDGYLHHGRVRFVYVEFCDVVWNCNEKEWWRFAGNKELISGLTIGWITGQDLIDTRYQ